MNINSWVSFMLVILGAIIMSVNIKKHYSTYKDLKLIPNQKRKLINLECRVHLILMCFFFLGYLLVAFGIVFENNGFNLIFVGSIFFLGAIFVFIGILIQSRMLTLINETFFQTIKALTSAIEVRDKYTMGHSEHVANLSVLICKKLSPKYDADMIEYAGLLHDIGKIGVPEEILHKSDSLSDSEYNIIKTHPKVGTDIIKNISVLDEISEWVLYHHERMDGNGYNNVSKENIPLEAKVIAIADTFSALVTDRPYREGMKHKKAIEIMKQCAGTQLDEEILEVFFNISIEEIKECMPKSFLIDK